MRCKLAPALLVLAIAAACNVAPAQTVEITPELAKVIEGAKAASS